MKKRSRLLIVLLVIGVCVAFLWPTLRWYAWTGNEEKIDSLGSRQQIKEIAQKRAAADLEKLISLAAKQRAESGAPGELPAEFGYLVSAAEARIDANKWKAPAKWSPEEILKTFYMGDRTNVVLKRENLDAGLMQAIEKKYRDALLDLKNVHGSSIQLGLDLSGGMSVVIEADLDKLKDLSNTAYSDDQKQAIKNETMARIVEELSSRIDKFGLTEPVIRRQGENQVYIEMPGVADADRINSIILGASRLAFHLVSDAASSALKQAALAKGIYYYDEEFLRKVNAGLEPVEGFNPKEQLATGYFAKDAYGLDEFVEYIVIDSVPGLEGKHLTSITTGRDTYGGNPEVYFSVDPAKAADFGDFTGNNKGKRLAIVLDGRVKSAPSINDRIELNGSIQGLSVEEAQNLAAMLRTSVIEVPLRVASQNTVGASLGEDAIRQGTMALVIGFCLVIAFMILYYLGAGFYAAIAQIMNLFFMVAILSAFNLTLTLPSVAGFVLTIGMAVDSNVLIFERIKEELRLKKGRKAAVDAGFNKAFWTIMDSQVTTLIAAVFLSQLGTGPIQGFAITLAIGVVSSMFTSLFLCRLFFDFTTDVLKRETVSISWRLK